MRYKEKSSAEQALIELVGRYDSLCLAPPSDIQADKFGYYTITFVNDKCLSKSDVWYIFSKVCRAGEGCADSNNLSCSLVPWHVSMEHLIARRGESLSPTRRSRGALNALETMLITKEYHLQVGCVGLCWKETNLMINCRCPRTVQ